MHLKGVNVQVYDAYVTVVLRNMRWRKYRKDINDLLSGGWETDFNGYRYLGQNYWGKALGK